MPLPNGRVERRSKSSYLCSAQAKAVCVDAESCICSGWSMEGGWDSDKTSGHFLRARTGRLLLGPGMNGSPVAAVGPRSSPGASRCQAAQPDPGWWPLQETKRERLFFFFFFLEEGWCPHGGGRAPGPSYTPNSAVPSFLPLGLVLWFWWGWK